MSASRPSGPLVYLFAYKRFKIYMNWQVSLNFIQVYEHSNTHSRRMKPMISSNTYSDIILTTSLKHTQNYISIGKVPNYSS